MKQHIDDLRILLKENNLDALFVSKEENVSYLSASQSQDSFLLVTKTNAFYLTDSRYTHQARLALKNSMKVIEVSGSIISALLNLCLKLKIAKLGFEGAYISVNMFNSLQKHFKSSKIKLIPSTGIIEELRCVKTVEEVTLIKKAIQITGQALTYAHSILKPGKTELQIAAEIERFIRIKGAEKSAFDIIVGSGPNASFPHHLSGMRKIRLNEGVLIDMGVSYHGYKSDLTRVFFLGKISASVKQAYHIVREAQKLAIAQVKPGAIKSEIDAAARTYISQQGFGKFFGHSLGHGVGLEVHEEPRISSLAKTRVCPGMIFTIEPGIYVPNKFGIRIEDVVLVNHSTCEVLSGAINK